MKNLTLVILAFWLAGSARAQDSAVYFAAFGNLVGGKWKSSGNWSDGTPFRQEVVVSGSLAGKLIRVQTYSNEAGSGNELILRNEGIRAWDTGASKMRFWEFDIHGGITEGNCTVDDNDIYYHYDYDPGGGMMHLTDGWIQKDRDTYEYKVGVLENGTWTKLFLEGVMRRVKE